MRAVSGSLWDEKFDLHLRVVPVNLGWKRNGDNVMGRGVAAQAAVRYPDLAAALGLACRNMADAGEANICLCSDLILFPVKPLNEDRPWMSWRQPADLALVEESARQLAAGYSGELVALSLVGCGNGGLDPADVLPVLFKHLRADEFTLVLTPLDNTVWASLVKELA